MAVVESEANTGSDGGAGRRLLNRGLLLTVAAMSGALIYLAANWPERRIVFVSAPPVEPGVVLSAVPSAPAEPRPALSGEGAMGGSLVITAVRSVGAAAKRPVEAQTLRSAPPVLAVSAPPITTSSAPVAQSVAPPPSAVIAAAAASSGNVRFSGSLQPSADGVAVIAVTPAPNRIAVPASVAGPSSSTPNRIGVPATPPAR